MNVLRRQSNFHLIYRVICPDIRKQRLHYVINNCKDYVNKSLTSRVNEIHPRTAVYSSIRYKSKKRQYDSDDEDVIADDDSSLSKDSKVVKFNTTSMRTDVILKSALTISRNKIEQAFYESKIRVNGKKIMKKSVSAGVGDELDVIKMVSPKNPDHLYVSRVEILNVAPKEEHIAISVRRFKNLLIENYENDPYKGSSESES